MRLRLRFSPFESLGQLRVRVGGGCRGGGPQRIGAHDDALAVGGDHDHVAGGSLGARLVLVERLEVLRGSGGQLLHLALADQDTGGLRDRRLRLLV